MKKKQNKVLKIIKYISLLLLIIFTTVSSFFIFIKSSININNETFLTMLLNEGNHNMLYEYKPLKVINKIIDYVTSIDINNPTSILNNGLMYEEGSSHEDNYSNLKELEKISSHIKDPKSDTVVDPLVYIYSTHQLENYNNKNLNPYNITPNVMMASYMLKDKLFKQNINALVEENDFTTLMHTKGYNYAQSYLISRLYFQEAKKKNPSLKYFIDLHRDSVSGKITTTTIENKSYAKVLFIVGLENKGYQSNLDITSKLNNKIVKKYPTLSRGIYKKQGVGVDGVYNQDLDKNAILIEVGGVDNTIEEVNNTLDLISNILSELIKEDI